MSQNPSILHRNLDALRSRDPALTSRVMESEPASLTWSQSKAGPLTAAMPHAGRTLQLASRYDPHQEASTLVDKVDLVAHAGVVVLGMGLGYHVADLAKRMGGAGVILVHEPDLMLLRAVFERIDCTAWLSMGNVLLLDADVSRGQLISRCEPFTTVLTQGTTLLTHPQTRQRCESEAAHFSQMVADVLGYCRTQVATAMVNAARTFSNLALNLGHYIAGADTNPLHDAARGYPAICVSAGPSLARNIELLCDPAIRRNVVVITAQTTLKPLLAKGIRPDFVTALDYAEISRRFYENLPPLGDVTLVAEPVANPAILDSFPGPVRITQNQWLGELMGDLAPDIINVPYGATVAHLSFYVAQHLGCDPILLLGQDLGFSDGLYYCPGTAIHEVWANELGPHNTLETMEWQRIVRHRHHLHRMTDIHGRPIFSDEQMLTYLKQFERDFAAAPQAIIDCTEGGVPKAHTTAMPLRQALELHATRPVPPLPQPPAALDRARLQAALDHLDQQRGRIRELRQISQRTLPLLEDMLAHQTDRKRMRVLFDKLQKQKKQVTNLDEALRLVNTVNAVGTFNRNRADRKLHFAGHDPVAQERAQIERDATNVQWILQACDEAIRILDQGRDKLAAQLQAARARQPKPATLAVGT